MKRRVAVTLNRGAMVGRRVAFVSVVAVSWVELVLRHHLSIAGDLGDDRRRGNRRAAAIAVKHAALDGEALDGERLDLPAGELCGKILQVGKRRFLRIVGRWDSSTSE